MRRTLYVTCSCDRTFHHVCMMWCVGTGASLSFCESRKISKYNVLSTSLSLNSSYSRYLRTRPYLLRRVRLFASTTAWGSFTSLLAEVQFKGKDIAHVMAHPFLFHSRFCLPLSSFFNPLERNSKSPV